MDVSVNPNNSATFVFENVKIGDVFLDDEGKWFMKVKYDEAGYDEQDVFGLCLENGRLDIFGVNDPVMQFFTPKNMQIQ